ncbi:hypothetical protein V6N11_026720 [Hibiscus sabdariffa]|uniref:Neprosin PEP catalytic domain-containing protein n=1 Tax=Hibiscus sabdariffa TaxID=183260 RepID=A0ABR2SWH3_9ROSI
MEAKTLEADQLLKDWHKNGECPEGTIPIVRSPQHRPRRKTTPFSSSIQPDVDGSNNHEATYNGEFSLAQIWVVADRGPEANTVEAGWQTLAGMSYTRLFIFWTSDGYKKTGCYNLECPGFVQTSHKLTLGGKIVPISQYGGQEEWKLVAADNGNRCRKNISSESKRKREHHGAKESPPGNQPSRSRKPVISKATHHRHI